MTFVQRIANFLSGRRVNPDSPPPYLLKIRSSKLFILTTICVAVFTDIFLYGIIVPVIPFSLSARAGVEESQVQKWVSVLLAVYGAALLVSSPFAGWYADNTSSRRLPLLIGLLALAGATVMLCLARTVALLVLGRILQGFSAGIVWTVGQALLVDTVGEREIGQTLGWVSLSMSGGILVAPLLGGVVYNGAGYYPVFYMAFAIIFLDIILRLVLIEKKVARQWLDDGELQSAIEPELTSPDVAVGEKEESDLDTGNAPTQGGEEIRHEDMIVSGEPDPVQAPVQNVARVRLRTKLPPFLGLLASRRLLAALWGCFVQASLMTSFDSVLPLFVQDIFHWNSIGAGLVFLALFIPNFAAPYVGAISDKYGPRWLTVTGFVLAVPFWVLLRLVTHDSLRQKVLLCALLALIGFTLTVAMTPLMAEITYVVEAKEKRSPGIFGPTGAYAQAYGLFVFAFAAGTLVGPVWSGFVRDNDGWGTMTWSLALFSLSGAVPALIWTGGLITQSNAKTGDERAINRTEAVVSSERQPQDVV
ncbi:MFS transporter-like protein [Xylogone sp. PMI_703]|nr:MFS transporter-like protein [Xylogone sp. PMI_703]